jgi:hypothetical protein
MMLGCACLAGRDMSASAASSSWCWRLRSAIASECSAQTVQSKRKRWDTRLSVPKRIHLATVTKLYRHCPMRMCIWARARVRCPDTGKMSYRQLHPYTQRRQHTLEQLHPSTSLVVQQQTGSHPRYYGLGID